MKRCVGIAVGVLASPCAAYAGAWTLPQGTGQAVVTTSASTASSGFDGSRLAPTARYNKFELQGLAEYGITDRLTVIAAPGLP